jgi:hypothetical protein
MSVIDYLRKMNRARVVPDLIPHLYLLHEDTVFTGKRQESNGTVFYYATPEGLLVLQEEAEIVGRPQKEIGRKCEESEKRIKNGPLPLKVIIINN